MVTSSGSYTFQVRATDRATNETVVTRNFTIDTGGPVITFGATTPLNLSAHRDPFDVIATATDPNGLASFAVTAPAALAGVDADATLGGLRVTVSPAALGDGNVTVALRAVDMAGNVGTVSRTFQLDRTAPTLSVTAPADGSYRNTAATITFSASDNLSTPSVSATLDGTPIASGATVNGEGPHTLTVRAVDAAGNEAVVSRTFTIDLTGPTVAFDVTTPAENSAHNATFLVKATASDGYGLASLVPVAPAGVPDNDGVSSDGDLELTVSPVALGDRYLTVTVRATDRAGNFAEAERHFWLDRTAPTGSVAQLSGSWYVAAGEATTTTVTMSGTSADATSGVASIAISRTPGGFDQTLTSGLGAWSTSVQLVADACNDATWTGDNTFDVVITDRAGNSTTIQDVVFRYDNCDADVAVVPTPNVAADTSTLLYDERSATVAVRATSYAPCPYQDSSLTPTTLSYDVNATPAPAASSTSYKYRANHAAAPMDCSTGTGWITGASPPSGYSPLGANRLGWYLDVRDNVGILSVQYEVKGPGEASYRAPQMAAAFALAGSTATHRFFMDESNVTGMDVEGVWEVRLTVTDLTGRVMSPANPIKWTHRVLAGPFYFESVPIAASTPIASPLTEVWVNPKATTFGLGEGKVMTGLYTASNKIVIQKVTVYNGTSKDGYAALTPSGSLSYTRWIWEGSHRDNWVNVKPTCANVVGEAYAPATASGTCLASAPADSHPATGQNGTGPAFAARGIDPATSQDRASISANGKTAYLVPAVDGGNPGKTDLYVVTSGWTFLFDQSGPSDFTFTAAGGSGAAAVNVGLFGKAMANWAVYDQYFPPGDPETAWPRHARARYLNEVSVSTTAGSTFADLDAFVTAAGIETDYGTKTFSLSFASSESSSAP